jgi:hypothetical protein
MRRHRCPRLRTATERLAAEEVLVTALHHSMPALLAQLGLLIPSSRRSCASPMTFFIRRLLPPRCFGLRELRNLLVYRDDVFVFLQCS